MDGSFALQILQETHGLHSLRAACEDKVAEEFEACSQHPDFGKLSNGQLARLLRREDLGVSREEAVVNALFTWNKVSKDGHVFLGMLLQHVHFNSLSIENLLRLGRTTLSGPSGDDLHREVEDALTRKRTQSPGTFQSKRRRLQQWSPFLGAILSWNPAGLSASARPVGGGAATGIDDLGLCCYLSISASGEVFVSDCDNQRLVRFQDGSGDLVVGNADVGPLLCTPSGVLYVASRNGRTVAKVVGSTLETVIASETLPVDMQFAACRVFASNFVIQSS